ncbi:soma ferritin-like [Limulus polyphemus]|uniref:Ferritin n=1 Tax=Limulus polyphemus TaxID=6850 RepID=A0ABM1AZF4_LIMPO|nr:soma ferritin-like [Limulus polyphemus]
MEFEINKQISQCFSDTDASCPKCMEYFSVLFCTDNDMKDSSMDRYILDNKCISGLQVQINEEMHASLVYMHMAAHFGSNSVGRKGFSKFFKHSSDEEREHAQKLIDYINKRSGWVTAFDIKMPGKTIWKNGMEALEDALNLENQVNNKLHHIHQMAEKICVDPHLMNFIEGEFLTEQVESINELKTFISQLGAMNDGMGEYLFDQELLEKSD